MQTLPKTCLALAAAVGLLGLSAQAGAEGFGGFGHPKTVTHLRANLVDTDTAASGRGEIAWFSDSSSKLVSVSAGISVPVGTSAYGLTDSNTAAAAPVTLTITHIATPSNVTYTCSLHIAELAFKAPVAPSTSYSERGDYAVTASQKNGTAVGPAFGGCDSFPATLASGDLVSVAIGSNTLTGTLK